MGEIAPLPTSTKFGKELLNRFCLRQDITHINNGSYGAIPRSIVQRQTELVTQCENDGEYWYRVTCIDLWFAAKKAAAKLLNCPEKNITFVPNATSGFNSILHSCNFDEEGIILITEFTYDGLEAAATTFQKISKATCVKINIDWPNLSKDQIINAYKEALTKYGKKIKLAVCDHIGAAPCFIYPIKEVIAMFREAKIPLFIDGAHAPGQLKLDMSDISPDFYVGNFHKWMFGVKPCAFLYIRDQFAENVFGPITSYDYFAANYKQEEVSDDMANKVATLDHRFFWQGTNNFVNYGCVPLSIYFYRDDLGIEEADSYCRSLGDRAMAYLAKRFKVEPFPVPVDMMAPRLRMCKVPANHKFLSYCEFREKYGISALAMPHKCAYRLSFHVYNCFEDYEKFADAVLAEKTDGAE